MQILDEAYWVNKLSLQLIKNQTYHHRGISSRKLTMMKSKESGKKYKLIRCLLPNWEGTADCKQQLCSEIARYNKVSHLNKIEFCGVNKETGEIVFATRLRSGEETLQKYAKKYIKDDGEGWNRLEKMAIQIAENVQLLHNEAIIHGSFSLISVSVYKDKAKLDLPLLKWVDKAQRNLFQTENLHNPYVAPQIKQMSIRSLSSDIYSLGVLFAQLYGHKLCHLDEALLLNREYILQLVKSCQTYPIRAIIRGMLSEDPQLRPNIAQVKMALRGELVWQQLEQQIATILSLSLINRQNISCVFPSILQAKKQTLNHFSGSFRGWRIELRQISKDIVFTSVELESASLSFAQVFHHRRIINYLQNGWASLRLTAQGCLEVEIPIRMQGIISIQNNQKQIREYLTEDEEEQLEILSPTFSKVKEQLRKAEGGLLSQQVSYCQLRLSPQVWESIGDQLFGSYRYDSAITVYQKIIEHNPFLTQEIDGLGNKNDEQFGYQGRLYQWYIEKRAKDDIKGSVFDALALCYQASQKYTEGMQWYNRMIKICPMDYRLHFGLATIYGNMFNQQKAEQIFKKVIELKPNFYKTYEQIAKIYFWRVYCPVSQQISSQWAKKALVLNSNSIKAEVMLAVNMPTVEEREECFSKIMKKQQELAFCKWQKISRYDIGKESVQVIEERIAALKSYVQRFPKADRLYHNIGYLMSLIPQKYSPENIQFFYKKSIQLNPKAAMSYNNLSYLSSNSQQRMFLLKKSISINPYSALVNRNLAKQYYDLKQFKDASIYFQKAIDANPNYFTVYELLGHLYFDEFKDYVKALRYYNQAVRINSKGTCNSFFRIGIIHLHYHEVKEAIENLNKSKELSPDFQNIYYQLGLCYKQLKKYHQSIQNFTKCHELKPDQPGLREEFIEVYGLMGDQQNANKWRAQASQ